MAKISELRKPDPTNLIIITILAFISGIGVNYLALQSNSIPGTDLPFLSKQSVSNVLKLLNISSSFSSEGIQHSIPYQLSKVLGENEGARFFWIIVTFFRAMLTRPLGKGLLMLLLTFSAPMLLAVSLETFRPKRSKWLSASMVILFTSVGQAICIGAATNLIYIPAYALARWRESTKEPIVRPTASPSASLVSIALTCSTLAGLTIFWTCLTPTDSDWWVLSNLAFQFFPLCYIPLLFIPTPSKQSTSREPRLAAARAYQLLSYLSIPAYYVSLYVAWPQIQPALSKAGANPFKFFKFLFSDLNDGEHLLLWDGLGLLVAAYAMVLIEAEADEAYVRNGGKPVHARRFLHEDIAVGWVGILLFGPGFGLATFFGRREMMAEKARWGVTSKSE